MSPAEKWHVHSQAEKSRTCAEITKQAIRLGPGSTSETVGISEVSKAGWSRMVGSPQSLAHQSGCCLVDQPFPSFWSEDRFIPKNNGGPQRAFALKLYQMIFAIFKIQMRTFKKSLIIIYNLI